METRPRLVVQEGGQLLQFPWGILVYKWKHVSMITEMHNIWPIKLGPLGPINRPQLTYAFKREFRPSYFEIYNSIINYYKNVKYKEKIL